MPTSIHTFIGRRAFLKHGSLVLAALGVDLVPMGSLSANEGSDQGGVKFGLITDLHYADKPPKGSRHYRETLSKLAEATKQFEKDKPEFVVELGDLIDASDSVETEQAYLKTVNKEFSAILKDRHYVLGNHCVDMLTKEEFLDGVAQKKAYYSFDRGGVHFVVLDACFRSDGKPYGRKNSKWNDANIPSDEVDWLKEDLKGTDKKVVVFAHQRLDVANDYGIKNAAEVRRLLEGSGKVLAVFQGHSHKNDYKEIGGVHYCTLVAMVEGSGGREQWLLNGRGPIGWHDHLDGLPQAEGLRLGGEKVEVRAAREKPSLDEGPRGVAMVQKGRLRAACVFEGVSQIIDHVRLLPPGELETWSNSGFPPIPQPQQAG